MAYVVHVWCVVLLKISSMVWFVSFVSQMRQCGCGRRRRRWWRRGQREHDLLLGVFQLGLVVRLGDRLCLVEVRLRQQLVTVVGRQLLLRHALLARLGLAHHQFVHVSGGAQLVGGGRQLGTDELQLVGDGLVQLGAASVNGPTAWTQKAGSLSLSPSCRTDRQTDTDLGQRHNDTGVVQLT